MTELALTPSQTTGPYLEIGLLGGPISNHLVDESDPRAIRISGVLLDGAGDPVPDGMIEIWQANAAGRYAHPADDREEIPLETGFTGFGRSGTESDGSFAFVTVKPGRVPWVDGRLQAPHLLVGVFARGPLEARGDPHVLPRRGDRERRGPRAPRARAGGADDPRRARGGRRASLRRRPPGRGPDDVLRGVTPFSAIFVPEELREAVSDRAWLQGMLDAESALAKAGAAVGLVPKDAAARIGEACRAELYDTARLADDGRAVGNPAEPLVRELRAAAGDEAADYVHLGATSQDIVDTAAMLVSRRAVALVLAELDRLADGCAELARAHRSTPMAARTLLQQAVPTTFGLKAAGWLVSVLEARRRLAAVRDERLAAQLGGAAGTLAALGDEALEVVRLYAEELGLAEPVLPWHTNRQRIAELGAALDGAAGAAAKVGRDIVLLAQSEVGEVAEASGGRSSTMPQKRNPVRSTLAVACARLAHAHAGVLLGELAHEHERAVGGWHAEWEALSGALAFAGGAAAAAADAVTGLEVDAERMRANLDASGGLVVAERISFALTPRLGRSQAHDVVAEAARAASFRDALLADARTGLTADELDVAARPDRLPRSGRGARRPCARRVRGRLRR